MIRAHKIRLEVNNRQSTMLYRTCGSNRYAYNWMLNRSKELYEQGEKFDRLKLKREFNAYKKELSWMKEVNAHAVSNDANERVASSFTKFFKKQNMFPRFHSKKLGVGTFSLPGSEIKYEDQKVYICKLGWLRLREAIRFNYTKIYRITVSNKAGKWYISFTLEIDDNRVCENQTSSVGIDLGIEKCITCSDGTVIDNPRILKHYSNRLRKLNKQLSRRSKGSKNWWKSVYALRRCYERVSDIRKDFIHKFTTAIAQKHGIVCLEDLHVKGMVKNHRLAKHILDVAFGEIERQFMYKALEVRYVGRFYPSSKTCSSCGNIKDDLKLSDRTYECSVCGVTIDRDLNASINIRNNAVSSTVTACGEFGDVVPSMKQELNSKSVNA